MITNKRIPLKDVLTIVPNVFKEQREKEVVLLALGSVYKNQTALSWRKFANGLERYSAKLPNQDACSLRCLCFVVGAETVEGPN